MAENSRGQNKSGKRQKSGGPAPDSHETNKRSKSSDGLRDTNVDRVRNDNRISKSSDLPDMTNISGTDYDGQLSDE